MPTRCFLESSGLRTVLRKIIETAVASGYKTIVNYSLCTNTICMKHIEVC